MTWGDGWGGFEWGGFGGGNFQKAALDSIASKADIETARAFLDNIAFLPTVQRSAFLDSVASGTKEVCAALDSFASRLPNTDFTNEHTQPVILVELQLPSGTVRVAARDLTWGGVNWEGRLLSTGEILRGLGDRADDVRIVVHDVDYTSAFGVSSRISDSFTDDPPEGAVVKIFIGLLDDPNQRAFVLFVGRIEEVASITAEATLELEVVRADAVEDRLIGQSFGSGAFPNAPEETLSNMIPIVFGLVDPHEGYVINFNARGVLDQAVDESATTFILVDASKFPSSGTGTVDDEQFTWAGKNVNELTGVVRGTGGTNAAAHPPRTEVMEAGEFEVQYADHALGKIEDVRIMDAQGNLGQPIPLPDVVDLANARTKWSEGTPRIKTPSRNPEQVRVGFETSGPSTSGSVTTPEAAAREAVNYSDLNFATVPASATLQLDRAKVVGELGTMSRVYLVVEFDPTGGLGASLSVDGNTVGSLSNVDTTPEFAIRSFEKRVRTTYDIQDPQHQHPSSSKFVKIRPQRVLQPVPDPLSDVGVFLNPGNAIDGNLGTVAQARGVDAPGAPVQYLPQPIVADAAELRLSSDETTGNIVIGLASGGPVDSGGFIFNPTNQCELQIFNGLAFVAGIRSNGFLLNQRHTVSRILTPAEVAGLGGVANFPNLRWVIAGVGDLNPTIYSVQDVFLDVGVFNQTQNAPTGNTQRRTISNWFDVTSIVADDWTWFDDTSRGGRVTLANAGQEARIARIEYVVEHFPFQVITTEVPRVFASVEGKVPTGQPTEILRSLITSAEPQGLGQATQNIAAGAYLSALSGLAADGIRLDFAIREQMKIIGSGGDGLLNAVANQADLRQWWDNQTHYVARKPDITALPSIFINYTADIVKRDSLSRARHGIEWVLNRLELKYKPDDSVSALSAVEVKTDAPSQALFGVRAEVLEFDLIRDAATAVKVADLIVGRRKLPRWLISFLMPLRGLELFRADFIGLNHTPLDFTAAKAEIESVSLVSLPQDGLWIAVSATVWEK